MTEEADLRYLSNLWLDSLTSFATCSGSVNGTAAAIRHVPATETRQIETGRLSGRCAYLYRSSREGGPTNSLSVTPRPQSIL